MHEYENSNALVRVEEPGVVERLNRSEIDMQIATARKFPRSIDRFRKNALTLATCDVDVAMSCNYSLPRGGKKIEGPSVRLAEIVCATYQHIRAGSRVIDVTDSSIVAQGICADLENNVTMSAEVRRRIIDKNGNRYNEDMINMTANAACAIAFRNAVFKVVPYALVKGVADAAKKVAIGTEKTLEQRRDIMIKKFGEFGVTKEMILAKLGKEGVVDINLKDMEILIGIYTAIDGGDASVESEFMAPEMKVEQATKKASDAPTQSPKQQYATLCIQVQQRHGEEEMNRIIDNVVDKPPKQWSDKDYIEINKALLEALK